MTRRLIIAISICFVLVLTGCANDDYTIEKKYWNAKKQAEKIFKNPHASPPNQLEKTVKTFNNFIAKFPKSNMAVDAEFTIANLYIVKGSYDQGRTQLRKMIQKYSNSKDLIAQALFSIGNSYEIEDKWPQALEQYKKIMQGYPKTIRSIEIPVYIAQHYKIKYEPDKMILAFQEAISHYKALAAKYPNTPLAYNMDMLVARCYGETKDWQSAANTLNSMLTTYKDKVGLEAIMLNMADIYSQKLNNKTKAIGILETLIKEYPKSRYSTPAKELIKRLSAK
jgi:TolA-binding protein